MIWSLYGFISCGLNHISHTFKYGSPEIGSKSFSRTVKPFSGKTRFGHQSRFDGAHIYGLHAVAAYRLYCLDGVRNVSSGEWIEADDDQAAIEVAKQTHDGYECELWQGTRLVVHLDLRRRG